MKRIFSLFLTLALFSVLLPLDAFAVEDTFTLSDEEMNTVLALAGSDSVYHEGMSYSDRMNAYQKFCWLTDFRENTLSAVKNRCSVLQGRIAENPSVLSGEEQESFREINLRVKSLDLLLDYWLFDLDREIQAVDTEKYTALDSDQSAGTRAHAYRRIKRAWTRLEELSEEIAAEGPASLESELGDMTETLDAFNARFESESFEARKS